MFLYILFCNWSSMTWKINTANKQAHKTAGVRQTKHQQGKKNPGTKIVNP